MSAPEQAAKIPSGVYYIVVASGHFQNQRLTDGTHVTVAPPNVDEEPKQKWEVQLPVLENGNILIKRPSGIRPALLLAYAGEGGPPKAGERIVLRPDVFPTEWHAGIAPGFRFTLHVAGSELGIGVGKEKKLPPFLNLAHRDQFVWMFERVGEE